VKRDLGHDLATRVLAGCEADPPKFGSLDNAARRICDGFDNSAGRVKPPGFKRLSGDTLSRDRGSLADMHRRWFSAAGLLPGWPEWAPIQTYGVEIARPTIGLHF